MARYRESAKRVGRDTAANSVPAPAPTPNLSLNWPPKTTPTPTATPTASQSNQPAVISNIAKRVAGLGVILSQGPAQILSGGTLFDTFNKSQQTAIAQLLSKFNYAATTKGQAKASLETYFSSIFNSAKSFSELMTGLQGEYIAGIDSTGPSVTQTIANYDPAVLKKLVENTYQSTIGRNPTEAESQKWMTEINKMIQAGTTTTSKKVGGKTVSVSTPGFSQERATTKISEGIKTTNAPEFQQQQSMNFMDWLSKNAAGA